MNLFRLCHETFLSPYKNAALRKLHSWIKILAIIATSSDIKQIKSEQAHRASN